MRLFLPALAILVLSGCATHGPAISDADRQAFEATRAKAEAGDVIAERDLGEMYLAAAGVAQDSHAAFQWLSKAADAGDARALYDLGSAYKYGWAGKQDPAKSQALFLLSAEQGLPVAEVAAGLGYLRGVGVSVDYAQALAWFKKAADAGDPNGKANLGYMYGKGLGVAQDYPTSMDWYKQAAQLGDRKSQFFLADVFHQGCYGEQKDETLSKQYFAQATGGVLHSYDEMIETMMAIINSHKVYPASAVKAKQIGKVLVEFDYSGHVASNIKVARSSGIPALDAAAIQAVETSSLPDRDPQLQRYRHFSIGVNFELIPQIAPTPAAPMAQ